MARCVTIIDGHNTVHRVARWQRLLGPHAEAAGNALIQYCRHWLLTRGDVQAFILVFDGTPWEGFSPAAIGPGIRIVFSGVDETADNRIIDLVRWEAQRQRCRVVSDDREVIRACRALGASVQSCSAFGGRLDPAATAAAPRPGSRGRAARADKAPIPPQAAQRINASLRREWGLE